VSQLTLDGPWQSLLADAPTSGRWPVILSESHSRPLHPLIDDAGQPTLPSATSLIEQARTLDPRRILDQWWQQNAEDQEALGRAWSEQRPKRPAPPVQARLIPDSGRAVIGLFPGNDSYEVPAILGYGGWNGSPSASEHVAILKYWQDHYDARLQAMSHDTIELIVGRPPETDADALALARDHFSYASDIPSDTVYRNVGGLASALPASHHWHFWWD
jgi:hypothetical protein